MRSFKNEFSWSIVNPKLVCTQSQRLPKSESVCYMSPMKKATDDDTQTHIGVSMKDILVALEPKFYCDT